MTSRVVYKPTIRRINVLPALTFKQKLIRKARELFYMHGPAGYVAFLSWLNNRSFPGDPAAYNYQAFHRLATGTGIRKRRRRCY